MNLTDIFDRLPQPRVLVFGDLMLDRYTCGQAERMSQEAAVLVLEVENRENRPGGAANVCLMLQALAASTTCVGVIGQDDAGDTLLGLLDAAAIDTRSILRSGDRPTTLKERFLGRSGSGLPSQILRVDTECRNEVSAATEAKLIACLERQIPEQDAVLISDYAKGVCTKRCIEAAIRIARTRKIPILVDPGRGRNFELYRGATLIKPNRPETETATSIQIASPQSAIDAGSQLCRSLDIEMAVVTLDADGMALVHPGGGQVYPTRARRVYDITGAGDMVLAMLGLGIGSHITPEAAVQLANVAAGLEVDRTGVTILSRDEIRNELQSHKLDSRRKIVDVGSLVRLAEDYRLRGKRIVMTNGCFDLLHVGHATYLEEAAAFGDVLVVAINSDASVKRLKGPERPVIGECERAAMLAALGCVEHVVVFDNDTPHTLLHAIRPHVLVKGGTYRIDEVVGKEVVEGYGGQVFVTGAVQGVSTTEIVRTVQRRSPLRQAG